MNGFDRRESKRFDYEMPAVFRSGQREVGGLVASVGHHGIFLKTGHPRLKGELIQIRIQVPTHPGTGPDKRAIKVMAVVAWSLPPEMAITSGRAPGMGMKFFMMSAEDKALWDTLYIWLQRTRQSEQKGRPIPAMATGPVKFLVRPRDLGQMRRFQTRSLAKGQYFLRTHLLKKPGTRLQVILIHPQTKDEFPLTARVVNVRSDCPLPVRGMKLQWLGIHRNILEDYQHFMLEGEHPIHQFDARLAG